MAVLEKYEGKIIIKELIDTIVGEYRKMFICPSWADDKDDDSGN